MCLISPSQNAFVHRLTVTLIFAVCSLLSVPLSYPLCLRCWPSLVIFPLRLSSSMMRQRRVQFMGVLVRLFPSLNTESLGCLMLLNDEGFYPSAEFTWKGTRAGRTPIPAIKTLSAGLPTCLPGSAVRGSHISVAGWQQHQR